ncbi:two-component system response regulator [Clostridia bacterium]|nr:two-component system response regulator [Clostridia bacterium]
MKTIFIVDDNQTNLVAAQQALSGTYKTLQITSAARMFALLEKIEPDLILLDIDMPETTGFEAMEQLQNSPKFKAIPVIFLTAANDEATEVRGFELGAVDFISKPFSKPILLKRLETHIGIDAIVKQRTAEVERHRADNERLKNGIITVLAEVVEERDNVTGGHIYRTQKYLEILLHAVKERGVYAQQTANLDLPLMLPSAQMHDIGKIVVSDLILNKAGKLTDEEYEIIKTHSAEGERIIDRVAQEVGENNDEFLAYARSFAGTHHEKWNGKGYPSGLSGEDIPLSGRAMAIVDVYDALTSERPYKKAFTHEEAVEIIKNDSGTAFDPKLVEVFLEVSEDFWINSIVEARDE